MRSVPESLYYDIEAAHEYQIDVRNREIYLTGERDSNNLGDDEGDEPGVEYLMATRLIRNLRILANRNQEPILIHMKTCGGYWTEGMAIHNAIKACSAHVTILSYTHARSMSSLILQAADHRVLMPDSYFMFHDGTYATYGTLKQVRAEYDFCRKVADPRMLEIYTDAILRTPHSKFEGQNTAQVRRILRKEMDKHEDVYLTAGEAVDWGLADDLFDGNWDSLKTE